jgi:hypothetical protein
MTNIKALTRCTSKNLMPGMIPPDGGVPADMLSVVLQVQQPSPATGLSGSITLTYSLADDQLQLGNYYEMTLVDSAPPPAKKT